MSHAPVTLLRHPDAPWTGPEFRVLASCAPLGRGALECRYSVEGPLAALALPAAATSARRDGLWQHTCFEAFVAHAGAPGYVEFNFSPGGAWAAYAFADYRAPLAPPAVPAPVLEVRADAGRLALTAVGTPPPWPADAGALEVGLSAVLELKDGTLGYYALGHPAARPDFHDRRGFRLRLPAAR
ncbi:MAG: DOMON-like domain-containing protein [Proteobacteria bacterium]|nr:DOMON-like domain-containing protein [Pseudomonadota bacterium]